jgi:RNA-binding protein
MSLSQSELKRLRAIGHNLKPVVIIAQKGMSEGVMAELDRALNDHELIKIRLSLEDREAKQELLEEICKAQRATLIQAIGKVALILRRATTPNPKLSNLLRSIP